MLTGHNVSSNRKRTLVLRFLVAPLEVLPPTSQVLLVLDRLGMHRLRRRSGTACASWSRRRTARGHAWQWSGRYRDADLLHARRSRRGEGTWVEYCCCCRRGGVLGGGGSVAVRRQLWQCVQWWSSNASRVNAMQCDPVAQTAVGAGDVDAVVVVEPKNSDRNKAPALSYFWATCTALRCAALLNSISHLTNRTAYVAE